jgi:hypothetical protein
MSFLVNPYSYSMGCDADALAFLAAAGITDATITSAICTLVSSMKSNGTWAKMNAIYPMVGGTATTHKFNLKNPLDTNAAFRLSFVGGWTHSANGALPNGTNAYADTFVAGNVNTQNSSHLSYYSRSNTAGGAGVFKVDMGYLKLTPSGINNVIIIKRDNLSAGLINSATALTTTTALTNTQGFYLANRTTSILNTLWKNGVIVNSSADVSVAPSTITNYIGARNSPDNLGVRNFTDRQCAFASIGSGLTDAEALALYNSVQAMQTTLSRQV